MNEYRLPEPYSDAHREADIVYPSLAGESDHTAVIWRYLRVLRRHAWKITGFVFAIVAAVLLYSLQLTPMYEATAVLELESVNQATKLGTDLMQYNYRNEAKVILTQLRLIDSPEIATAVARDLGLDRSPLFGYDGEGEPVMPSHLPGLKAEMIPDTYLMAVTYRSPSAELSRDIANSVAKAYIEHGYQSRYQNSKELQDWLDKQLEGLRARSERAQEDLLEYERDHNLFRSEGRTDLAHRELEQVQAELINTQAERVRKQTAYRNVEAGGLEDLLVVPQGSPLVTLLSQRETLQSQLAEASSYYGPNHPEYKKLQTRIDQLDKVIARARDKVLQRLAAEYREVVSREQALRESYLAKKAEVERLSELAVEYGTLQREASATTALYEQLLQTVNEVGLQSSLVNTSVRIAEPASLPQEPVHPNIPRNVWFAFWISTGLGIGGALLADFLDRTVRSTEQVEQWLRVPVLANLPRVTSNKRPQAYLLPAINGSSVEQSKKKPQEVHALVEGFAMLRTSLLLSTPADDLRLMLVASAVPAEGKSTVAAGLATALAQQVPVGKRIVLVDGDLRRPTVHSTFCVPNRFGLTTLLEGSGKIEDVVFRVDSLPSLYVMPRGPAIPHANELLAANMGRILEELRQKFEYVVVDSAPLLASADTTILSTLVDGVLLVARAGGTSRDMVGAAFRQVRRVRGNVVGLVLNQVQQPDQEAYRYYYNYYGRREDA